jgi:hypothetical protein
MSSQVKSQITDKLYETTLDDLYEFDQGLEVDLYKINVFNKDIMIAPGKVISDTKKDVHYCYVYVIKNGRVAAKLGIYETLSKKDDVYDLTDFEGREFLLFDHYYNEPGVLVEYEMKEEVQIDNIFDYLKRFLKPVTNATATIKEQAAVIKKITKRMGDNPLANNLKNYKMQKPYDEEWLDSFKEDAENWMFNLIVLEVIFNIKFIFENSDGSEDEMREIIRSSPNESTTIIRVSLEDMPRHVTNKTLRISAAVEEEEEEEEEEFVKGTFPSPSEVKPTIESFPEEKSTLFSSESKSEKSFSSKPPPKSFSSKASSEAKPSKSFSSKPPPEPVAETKSFSSKASKPREQSPEAKPSKSFSSKPPPEPVAEAKPSKSFSSKPPPEPVAETKSFSSKASKPREQSPEAKPSKSSSSKASSEERPKKSSSSKAREESEEEKPKKSFSSKASAESVKQSASKGSEPRPEPSLRKSASRDVSPSPRPVSPAEEPSKPKKISLLTPVKKLKNSAP